MILRLRPITKWPKEQTPAGERKWSPFMRKGDGYRRTEVPYSETLRDLDRELTQLGAQEAVLQLAVREDQIRLDGEMRANVTPSWPGVILTFTAPGKGVLTFACDRFERWPTNLRAITKGLEALRLVDRYGITSSGEQYVGWKELPSGIPLAQRSAELEEMSIEQAARIVVGWVSQAHDLAQNARTAIEDADYRRYAYRQALKHLHPDAGGSDTDAFLRLQQAIKVLDENDEAAA
jgi:hypothetical protein